MAEEKRNFEYLPENYEEEMLRRKKAKKVKIEETLPPLAITSLMDILTILLVFLLKSYSTETVNVTPSADLEVPKSTAILSPAQTIAVTVSKTAILVDNSQVMSVKDGKVDGSLKRGGDDGYFITPLNNALVRAAEKVRQIQAVNPTVKFDGICTIIMDRDLPYRLLTEVMYTAGQAEFSKFKFLVISTSAS